MTTEKLLLYKVDGSSDIFTRPENGITFLRDKNHNINFTVLYDCGDNATIGGINRYIDGCYAFKYYDLYENKYDLRRFSLDGIPHYNSSSIIKSFKYWEYFDPYGEETIQVYPGSQIAFNDQKYDYNINPQTPIADWCFGGYGLYDGDETLTLSAVWEDVSKVSFSKSVQIKINYHSCGRRIKVDSTYKNENFSVSHTGTVSDDTTVENFELFISADSENVAKHGHQTDSGWTTYTNSTTSVFTGWITGNGAPFTSSTNLNSLFYYYDSTDKCYCVDVFALWNQTIDEKYYSNDSDRAVGNFISETGSNPNYAYYSDVVQAYKKNSTDKDGTIVYHLILSEVGGNGNTNKSRISYNLKLWNVNGSVVSNVRGNNDNLIFNFYALDSNNELISESPIKTVDILDDMMHVKFNTATNVSKMPLSFLGDTLLDGTYENWTTSSRIYLYDPGYSCGRVDIPHTITVNGESKAVSKLKVTMSWGRDITNASAPCNFDINLEPTKDYLQLTDFSKDTPILFRAQPGKFDDDTSEKSVTKTFGTDISLSTVGTPSHDYKTFNHWYYINGIGKCIELSSGGTFNDDSSFDESLIVYSKWSNTSFSAKFYCDKWLDGSTGYKVVTSYTFDDTLKIPSTPSKTYTTGLAKDMRFAYWEVVSVTGKYNWTVGKKYNEFDYSNLNIENKSGFYGNVEFRAVYVDDQGELFDDFVPNSFPGKNEVYYSSMSTTGYTFSILLSLIKNGVTKYSEQLLNSSGSEWFTADEIKTNKYLGINNNGIPLTWWKYITDSYSESSESSPYISVTVVGKVSGTEVFTQVIKKQFLIPTYKDDSGNTNPILIPKIDIAKFIELNENILSDESLYENRIYNNCTIRTSTSDETHTYYYPLTSVIDALIHNSSIDDGGEYPEDYKTNTYLYGSNLTFYVLKNAPVRVSEPFCYEIPSDDECYALPITIVNRDNINKNIAMRIIDSDFFSLTEDEDKIAYLLIRDSRGCGTYIGVNFNIASYMIPIGLNNTISRNQDDASKLDFIVDESDFINKITLIYRPSYNRDIDEDNELYDEENEKLNENYNSKLLYTLMTYDKEHFNLTGENWEVDTENYCYEYYSENDKYIYQENASDYYTKDNKRIISVRQLIQPTPSGDNAKLYEEFCSVKLWNNELNGALTSESSDGTGVAATEQYVWQRKGQSPYVNIRDSVEYTDIDFSNEHNTATYHHWDTDEYGKLNDILNSHSFLNVNGYYVTMLHQGFNVCKEPFSTNKEYDILCVVEDKLGHKSALNPYWEPFNSNTNNIKESTVYKNLTFIPKVTNKLSENNVILETDFDDIKSFVNQYKIQVKLSNETVEQLASLLSRRKRYMTTPQGDELVSSFYDSSSSEGTNIIPDSIEDDVPEIQLYDVNNNNCLVLDINQTKTLLTILDTIAYFDRTDELNRAFENGFNNAVSLDRNPKSVSLDLENNISDIVYHLSRKIGSFADSSDTLNYIGEYNSNSYYYNEYDMTIPTKKDDDVEWKWNSNHIENNNCSATCMGLCSQGCYNTCVGGCNTTCGESCSSLCSNDCTNGCSETCKDSCGTDCTGVCGNGCENDCGVQCTGDCNTSCDSTCYNSCSTKCISSCKTTCNEDCKTICSNTCTKNCKKACTTVCVQSCDKWCYNTCVRNCASDCSDECGDTCKGKCTGGCGSNCKGSCGTSCGGVCTYYCGNSCRGNCYGKCKNQCKGCTGTCIGTCKYGCHGKCTNSSLL